MLESRFVVNESSFLGPGLVVVNLVVANRTERQDILHVASSAERDVMLVALCPCSAVVAMGGHTLRWSFLNLVNNQRHASILLDLGTGRIDPHLHVTFKS